MPAVDRRELASPCSSANAKSPQPEKLQKAKIDALKNNGLALTSLDSSSISPLADNSPTISPPRLKKPSP